MQALPGRSERSSAQPGRGSRLPGKGGTRPSMRGREVPGSRFSEFGARSPKLARRSSERQPAAEAARRAKLLLLGPKSGRRGTALGAKEPRGRRPRRAAAPGQGRSRELGRGARGKGDPTCLPPLRLLPAHPPHLPAFPLSLVRPLALYQPPLYVLAAAFRSPPQPEGGEARESPAASRDAGPRPLGQGRPPAESLRNRGDLGTRRARAAATGGGCRTGGEVATLAAEGSARPPGTGTEGAPAQPQRASRPLPRRGGCAGDDSAPAVAGKGGADIPTWTAKRAASCALGAETGLPGRIALPCAGGPPGREPQAFAGGGGSNLGLSRSPLQGPDSLQKACSPTRRRGAAALQGQGSPARGPEEPGCPGGTSTPFNRPCTPCLAGLEGASLNLLDLPRTPQEMGSISCLQRAAFLRGGEGLLCQKTRMVPHPPHLLGDDC